MMYKIFFAALAIGASVAAPAEFGNNLRRGLDSGEDCYKCSDHDPCMEGDSEFYEHCNKHKYIQCSNGHCYDMHCPGGTQWDQDEESCEYKKGKPRAPCGECEENPCTKENLKAGMYYHPHCDKKKKYLQCGAAVGVCHEMDCAEGTVWDEDEMACAMKGGMADLDPCGDCENPCTEENIDADMMYHPHCDKKRMYLQCGATVGMCFERKCGEDTKWDQDQEACA